MNTDISKMVKALEAEGWSIGTDGRVARSIERGSATIAQVNASPPLARVALNGKTRWVSVRDLVAFQHLGLAPANMTLTSIDGNAANTAVANLEYRPRTGKQAEAQAERAEKAQQRAEKLAQQAEVAAQKAKEAAEKAAVAAGLAPPSAKRTGAAKQAA